MKPWQFTLCLQLQLSLRPNLQNLDRLSQDPYLAVNSSNVSSSCGPLARTAVVLNKEVFWAGEDARIGTDTKRGVEVVNRKKGVLVERDATRSSVTDDMYIRTKTVCLLNLRIERRFGCRD